jgi:type II secretory pathway component GspD/PulD (secretin)
VASLPSGAPAEGVPALADRPGGPGASPGASLLDKARLELRHGETETARRLAVQASEPQYGVRDEALAVLRSIDTEEFNQKRLRANRTFDAAWSAYVRRDYPHSAGMIAAIDTQLLDEPRQVRLRDMMATPEMQPSARGPAAAPAAGGGARDALVQAGAAGGPGRASAGSADPAAPPGAGRAHAADDDQALLVRTQAMREIKFQALRKEALEVQSAAAEKFRSGQAEAAIDMLQDHIAKLQEVQLDPGQLTLLRRPLESRLQQFKLLREQEAFANRQGPRSTYNPGQVELAEQTKQKHVADLMKQFNTFYKEGKYHEAESMAMRAYELDPDNSVVSAAIHMARMHQNVDEAHKLKDAKEKFFLTGLNDTDKVPSADVIDKGIAIDPEASRNAANRKYPASFTPPRRNEKEREIERKLSTPVTLNFTDAPLKTVIEDIRAFQGMNIFVDENALSGNGISLDRPVTVKLDQVSLKSALALLLRPMHLTAIIKDEVLQITTEDNAKGGLVTSIYQVADLVIPVQDFGTLGAQPSPVVTGTPTTGPVQTTPSPVPGLMSLPAGQPVGSPTGSMASPTNPFTPPGAPPASGPVVVKRGPAGTTEEQLIRLIMNTVSPKSWGEMGGPGTVDYFPLTMSLVINQTPDIQDQIIDLLAALRRLQDQEVTVEIRFITIAEDFFERIGVNFNVNFVNRHNGARFQPQLTTNNFTPDDFINKFQPHNFLTGLQPAGTFTPDLNIPLNVDTFQQSIPPFGGYQGIPGFGGVTLGLAYLSDIQVFLFMEAAQGDVRTNVMQAPKLSMFNGQTASITVADQQFFLTGVQVIPQQGIFTYNPSITQFPLGVNLTMNAVISADRRFVRMSMTPTLTNLASPIVDLFPVVVPIFPNFDGTGSGQPIVFTQFIQMPHITTLNVMTTVAVPDGGTVLMGGLKRLSEGRNEYGPPVLSKIPWLNRLFKNVGYGREAESLLIMVTPRIIIQAEEEERQTGVIREPSLAP